MYKNLFVPVDGSALSHRLIDGSVEFAKQLGARIVGFVVEPDLPLSLKSINPETFAHNIENHAAKNHSHAAALLRQFEERAQEAGIEFLGRAVTAYGVDQVIMDEAERAGCDMIVMITHARGAAGEFLFGSHTKKIIAQSRLPVLVLH
jgi:nucleotide-binding universal stress UspA family protein